MNPTDETKKKESLAERAARIMSDLLSDQFGVKITIILEDDDVNQDEPTEGENK